MLKAVHARSRRPDDEGAIAIMAAAIIPVILLVIALSLSSLVWGTSEAETQRASDQSALQSAASALLVPSAGASVAPVFPTLNSVIPSSLNLTIPGLGSVTTSLTQNATNCKTIGNVYTSVKPLQSLINALTSLPALNNALSAINAVNPSLYQALTTPSAAACSNITVVPDATLSTFNNACSVASAAMTKDRAPWSNNFFGGSGSSVPDCATNGRVSVSLSDSENNLLDLGGTNLNAGSLLGSGPVSPTAVFSTVQTNLAKLGVRLQTTLPNSLCPKVSVSIDQPVSGPLADKVATPNGRSTAQRIVKNAVIVPVFNGASFISPVATITGTTSPAIDLNTTILGPLQGQLTTALDAVDNAINQQLALTNTVVNSTTGASVGQLDLLGCLHDTVASLYNPPTGNGSAPTTSQLTATMTQTLTEAALSGKPVEVISVGVRSCSGAASALDIYNGCLAPALGTVGGVSSTGLYDVPFLDVTPVIINNVGNGNFQAVPVAATQASGAFRSVLVRGSGNDRFLP
ncbi:MAG: hypothetical protein JWO22_1385 [Frankiales bacterium]|nr:hypothetical protein [Frankiales bacterium]